MVVVQMVMCAAAGLGPAQPRRTGQLPHRRTSTSTSSRVRQCSQHHGAAPPTAEHSTALQHCSTAAACPGHCRGYPAHLRAGACRCGVTWRNHPAATSKTSKYNQKVIKHNCKSTKIPQVIRLIQQSELFIETNLNIAVTKLCSKR